MFEGITLINIADDGADAEDIIVAVKGFNEDTFYLLKAEMMDAILSMNISESYQDVICRVLGHYYQEFEIIYPDKFITVGEM